MNPVSDERFMELAMKLVGFECTAEEKAELHRIIDQSPERREQLQKICISAGISRELLPLANALEATEGEMTADEMAAFRLQVGRVRRSSQRGTKPPPPEDHPPHADDDERSGGDEIIEAEIVPEKPINGYKLAFYLLLLLILIGGLVLGLKSCRPLKNAARKDTKPPAAAPSEAVPKAARASTEPATPPIERPSAPAPVIDRSPPAVEVSSPVVKSSLPSYQGAQWVKVFDANSRPGFRLSFTQFVAPAGATPMVEGLIGPNGGPPTKLMVLKNNGKGWEAHSFPGVPREPDLVEGLDSDRVAMSYESLPCEVFLIEGARARRLAILGMPTCTAVHAVSANRFFLHCYDGSAYEVNGSKVTRLMDTDAASYVHLGGNPTDMRRGSVHSIAKADTGETMGIFWRRPAGLGLAALVRFNGTVWEYVCSLEKDYVGKRTHFLNKDTMVAVRDTAVVVVKDGQPETMDVPSEFEALRSARFMAVRAASTDDFVLVDNYGGVYRHLNGKYQLPVRPMAAFQGVGTSSFRSVMIAADGAIYGIQGYNKWNSTTIFKLTPK